jgi:hypothetical protein
MPWIAFLLLLFALSPPLASAFDGIAVTVGRADKNGDEEPLENTYVARIAVTQDLYSVPDHHKGNWYEESFWEFGVGQWRWSERSQKGKRELWEIEATPVFRLKRGEPSRGLWPFVEAGIGAHLLSETRVAHRDISTNFQFGSHVGAGANFGAERQYELQFRFQHLSNGGIETPNPGVNFFLMRFGYRFPG